MKKLLLLLLSVALCSAATLFGQTFTGTWQGTLKVRGAPGALRIVFQITGTDKGALQADMYSVDQPGQHVKYVSVTQNGSTIRMTLAGPNGNYDGKLSPDGNTLTVTGDWDLGAPTPLTLTKATPETAWTIPEPPPSLVVMDPKARPEFEVATIKPSAPGRRGYAFVVNKSGILNAVNISLVDLIKFAYNVHLRQVSGAPAWVESAKFDITAKPDLRGMPNGNQLAEMLQKLLTDRFGMTFHREKKELSVYLITVARDGPKIAKAAPNPMTLPGWGGRPSRGFNVRNATMADFAGIMQKQFMDQPVVDQTGLGDQRYDFVLKWTPDRPGTIAERSTAER